MSISFLYFLWTNEKYTLLNIVKNFFSFECPNCNYSSVSCRNLLMTWTWYFQFALIRIKMLMIRQVVIFEDLLNCAACKFHSRYFSTSYFHKLWHMAEKSLKFPSRNLSVLPSVDDHYSVHKDWILSLRRALEKTCSFSLCIPTDESTKNLKAKRWKNRLSPSF